MLTVKNSVWMCDSTCVLNVLKQTENSLILFGMEEEIFCEIFVGFFLQETRPDYTLVCWLIRNTYVDKRAD